MADSPLGKILESVHKSTDIIDRYLHDFVRMVYAPRGTDPEKEYQVGRY
jgi:hypothetical protein